VWPLRRCRAEWKYIPIKTRQLLIWAGKTPLLEYPCPSLNLVYVISHLSFVGFYSYLISWLVMIWHVHIISISRMVDFSESNSPFHVCLAICPIAHLVYATSVAYTKCADGLYGQTKMKRAMILAKINHPWNRYNSLLLEFIHIWYLGWPWSEHAHIILISRMVDFCESYSPFHVCLAICSFAHLVYATSRSSFVGFYSYLVSWLAMIYHPWNQYNMRMLRSWPTKIPNMNKIQQKTND
jgi:uncharacterized protein YqcC (DUF446 family)